MSAKKRDFKFYCDTSNENENFINTINDYDFIVGFSLIFDKQFDQHYNFNAQIINPESNGEASVEIRLWQREIENDSKYKWVNKKINNFKIKFFNLNKLNFLAP